MSDYETIIGLEVHAQLKTLSKIFCSCSTQFGNDPNTNTCHICTGMPGVLPVLNKKAVEFAVKMSLALDCRVNPRSVFARKNYFYPDLPRGYQISQYEEPLAEHGHIKILSGKQEKDVGITRIHMEEDAGKSIHSPSEGLSYVDLNRSGVPLMEIVSEPDMRSPEEATAYLKALRSIMRYLDISDGNMEEGSFRCDANVSIRPRGRQEFGTRTEIKNLNSFRNVQKALEYEVARQMDLLEDREDVIRETRLFDPDKGITVSMRGKEEAHDYRYFPDPDLVPLLVDRDWIEKLEKELPELPMARQARFMSQYELPDEDAQVLTSERDLADYFEECVKLYQQPKTISNWVMTELLRELNQAGTGIRESNLSPQLLTGLLRMVDDGTISNKIAKSIFPEVFAQGVDPVKLVQDKGLTQISDSGALEGVVDEVIRDNPDEVRKYREGRKKLMSFFVGQVMKKTKGQANPGLVNAILNRKLG
ncbi:Asp-tRNA(Asn)/Glu-tRNA(Gln) amidotransferase subunit GatB [Desulfonatronospira sp.]|uniref:Asp-tRNA(Asn)/Glu-tRNA(Gln) amidotransferase subunit GatB n=1 Tax=Desulfonatronospira sp. TaxID=1962951 RepID=UPI0025BE0E17|nr:Asp-tRNA(Asn)/Glu-tRNA(Gln) amidotransferase subunit GatB [Desulfonatronospira sp.]